MIIHVSTFENLKALKIDAMDVSPKKLNEWFKNPLTASTKSGLRLLSLNRYGDLRTEKGALRHDKNVIAVTGLVGDYDGGIVPIDQAAERLEKLSVKAMLYTSPSSTESRPRWRVVAPLSAEVAPDEHLDLMGKLNAVLGGILAPESFTLSQSFYYGRAKDAAHYAADMTLHMDRWIDQVDIAPVFPQARVTAPVAGHLVTSDAKLKTGDGRREKLKSYIASASARGLGESEIHVLAKHFADQHFDPSDPVDWGDVSEIIKWATTRDAAQRGDMSRGVITREPWSDPQPLIAKIDPEPYPIDAIPAMIRAAVDEVAGFVQAPVALVVNSALAALSAAAQGHIDVRRAERLHGPAGLFLLAIADSGERKSTCDSFFTKTIREFERQQADEAVPALRRYTSVLAAWQAEREGILQAIKQNAKTGKPVERLRVDLAELEQRKPEAPRIPRLIYGDSTPEALTFALGTRWPSGAVISAEAGSIFGAHGMGKDSIMRNLSTLNELWDGKPMTFDRRSTESYTVRGARLTVGLAIQAATLREFLGKSGALARGSGFLARFLICAPMSTQGTRPFSEAPKSWPALEAFNRRITEILNQPVAMTDDGALTPTMLELSPGAKAVWIEFHDEIESELSLGGELHDVRDVASKAADNAARLAGLFHIFSSGAGAISEEAFAGAARIVAWHLSESRRFFGELAVPTEIANAHRLDDWLINHCRIARVGDVSTKVVQHRGPGPLRDRVALQAALTELEELGRIRIVMAGKRRLIEINPALLPAAGDDGAR